MSGVFLLLGAGIMFIMWVIQSIWLGILIITAKDQHDGEVEVQRVSGSTLYIPSFPSGTVVKSPHCARRFVLQDSLSWVRITCQCYAHDGVLTKCYRQATGVLLRHG